jgi:predicted RNA-binding Zn-ribbon protein involved in translation (DUF1610 family)
MRTLTVAHVRSATDIEPAHYQVTWPKWASRLTRLPPCRADLVPNKATESELRKLKSRLPAWIPARFEPDAPRQAAHVVDLHFLVLDYDDGATIEQERERWSAYAHCGHTSWSHALDTPKFRLVLPLARPVAVFWWARVWEWALRFAPGIDRATRNPDRIYFLPAIKRPSAPWQSWTHDGPWLDVEGPELPATAAELEQARRADAMRQIRERRPYNDAGREANRQHRLLLEDPETRHTWAIAHGGHVSARTQGRIATGITCPACGDASVWLAIDVVRATGARCNHQRSCGWSGPLSEIS